MSTSAYIFTLQELWSSSWKCYIYIRPKIRRRYEYGKKTYSYKYGKRSQMFINIYRNPKTLEIGSSTKLLFTFLNLRFSDMRRETHNFFNKRAAHFVDPNWSKNRLPSFRLESQLTGSFFLSNSKILSASEHEVIHVPGLIIYPGFLLRHL